jgi:hypothetical protein
LTPIPFNGEPTALTAAREHADFHSISQPEASAYGSRSRSLIGIDPNPLRHESLPVAENGASVRWAAIHE